MWGSATLPSPISRPRPEAPYNAACVRGPAAELTPQEIRENAVLRGSRSEEAVRFVDIGSEKTVLAAAFRRHGFGSRSIRHGSSTGARQYRAYEEFKNQSIRHGSPTKHAGLRYSSEFGSRSI